MDEEKQQDNLDIVWNKDTMQKEKEQRFREHIRDKEQERNEQYNKYVNEVTPKPDSVGDCIKAFITGGCICVYGQVLMELLKKFNVAEKNIPLWTTILLILTSVLLTGLNIYPRITTWGGAGSLVPITGFANSVAAPAIEYKKEGQVFGVGAKIFTIAGPVILYGILCSWICGLIYWVLHTFGLIQI